MHKMFPFTIRLVDRELESSEIQPIVIKIDPGSKETGIAIVREGEDKTHHALYFINLKHRGQQIRDALFKKALFEAWTQKSQSAIPSKAFSESQKTGRLAGTVSSTPSGQRDFLGKPTA